MPLDDGEPRKLLPRSGSRELVHEGFVEDRTAVLVGAGKKYLAWLGRRCCRRHEAGELRKVEEKGTRVG